MSSGVNFVFLHVVGRHGANISKHATEYQIQTVFLYL